MSKHTPGNYKATEWEDPVWVVTNGGEFNIVCSTVGGDDEAKAQRIAQCLNALKGIEDVEEFMKESYDAISGSLSLIDLWIPKGKVDDEHKGEALALCGMAMKLRQALDLFPTKAKGSGDE